MTLEDRQFDEFLFILFFRYYLITLMLIKREIYDCLLKCIQFNCNF